MCLYLSLREPKETNGTATNSHVSLCKSALNEFVFPRVLNYFGHNSCHT